MNGGAVAVDKAELIKWYDALDTLTGTLGPQDVEKGLQMACECQHPDAVWLASLFPAGAEVTQERVREVMLQQGDDPRAMWIAWRAGGLNDKALLSRAAERGFARAQVDLAHRTDDDAESLRMPELAVDQEDREALYKLGDMWLQEEGKDITTAIEPSRRAAELNDGPAQEKY
jgi:hypothetical protein